MKKNFCKVLAMAIVTLMMMSSFAFAAENPAVTPDQSVGTATATLSGLNPGEEATILVINDVANAEDRSELSSVENEDIVYIDQLTVGEDGTVTFTFDASAAKAAANGDKIVDVYCGYTSMEGVALATTDVTVYKAPVTVVSIAATPASIEIPAGTEDIAAYIKANIAVTATMSDESIVPVTDYEIVAADNVATITYKGQTTTVAYTEEVVETVMYGDVNGDESADSTDASLILQNYAGIAVEVFNATAANVNGDDGADSTDASLVLQRYAGLIEKFPVE